MGSMKWLPAMRAKHSGLLLPLSCETSEFLAALLSDASDGCGPLADLELAASSMAIRLRQDPALYLFSLIERADHEHQPALTIERSFSLSEHAAWLCKCAPAIFCDSQRALLTARLANEIGFAEDADGRDWKSIAKKTLRLPLEAWAGRADRWLVGEKQIGWNWRKAWPTVVDDTFEATSPDRYGTATIDLFRLARGQRELRLLKDRFASKLHAEKMASLRQLAYGLSHEINNPLAAIRSRAEQMTVDERDPDRREKLAKIVGSAMRAHEMIADMMYFARPPKPVLESLDAVELTERVLGEFRQAAANASVELKFTTKPTGIEELNFAADRIQIGDALRAVIRNAIEATGDHGTISVVVRTSGAVNDKRIVWTVTDNGPGLSEEARQHAFDPYYSGREAGRGLGLGLSRVYRVARAHGGGATIDGTEVGCRVRVWVRLSPKKSTR